MIEWIDGRILALFTKFSHWFQRLTGKTNYFIAWVSAIFASFAIFEIALNYWISFLPFKSGPFSVIVCLIFAFALVCVASLALDAEEDFQKEPSVMPWVAMRERESGPEARLGYVSFAPINLGLALLQYHEFHHGVLLLTINLGLLPFYIGSFFYLVLVDPLGPSKSKIKEWLECFQAGFQKLQPAHNPRKG